MELPIRFCFSQDVHRKRRFASMRHSPEISIRRQSKVSTIAHKVQDRSNSPSSVHEICQSANKKLKHHKISIEQGVYS
jgi:hypothetical protein